MPSATGNRTLFHFEGGKGTRPKVVKFQPQPDPLAIVNEAYPRLAFTYEAGADLIFNVDMARRAWGEKN